MTRQGNARCTSALLPLNIPYKAVTARKGHAASVRRQSRQRLRSDRRYTPYFGVCRFHGRLYGSEVRSRERHAAPLQWCTPFNDSRYELEVPSRDCHVGLRPPRNDKPLDFIVLSIACTGRQHCAGPGCPLPYNARPKACVFFILHFSVFRIHFHVPAPLQRISGGPAKNSTLRVSRFLPQIFPFLCITACTGGETCCGEGNTHGTGAAPSARRDLHGRDDG